MLTRHGSVRALQLHESRQECDRLRSELDAVRRAAAAKVEVEQSELTIKRNDEFMLGEQVANVLCSTFGCALAEMEADLFKLKLHAAQDREAHAAQLAALRSEHSRELQLLRSTLREEQRKNELLRQQLEGMQAPHEIARLRQELVDLQDVHASTLTNLAEMARQAARETDRDKAQADAKLRAAIALEQQTRTALGTEVRRLRDVQDTVLSLAGALPGGEARRYLFYESMKSRKVLQPESTTSWRGQHEMRFEKGERHVSYELRPWHEELRGP